MLLALVVGAASIYGRVARARAPRSRSSSASSACSPVPKPCTTRAGRPVRRRLHGFLSLLGRFPAARRRLCARCGEAGGDRRPSSPSVLRRALIARRTRPADRGDLFPAALAYVVTHTARGGSEAQPRRTARRRRVRDERRSSARGLVHAVAKRRHRDRRSRALGSAEADAHARPPRLRRPPLRPPRRGRERRRPERLRLGRRPGSPCGRRLSPQPPGRRPEADRRHRPLGRRRDADPRRRAFGRVQGDRLRGRSGQSIRDG